jgi:hypothetical protein
MIQITDDMRRLVDNALADGFPCILATASPVGEPSIGYRGSMMIWDDESLAYWERSKRVGLANIEANSKVAVIYRNTKERQSWKFYGDATVHHDGPVREQVMARTVQRELDSDPELQGFGVIIRVNRITLPNGTVVQERE